MSIDSIPVLPYKNSMLILEIKAAEGGTDAKNLVELLSGIYAKRSARRGL